MGKLRDHHEVTSSVGMPASWWSKKENVEKYVEAFFDYQTRIFQSQHKDSPLSP